MTKDEFAELAGSGTLLLDGATGTNLFLKGMPKGVCTEAWVLDHPGVITDLQSSYADAGSRIIYAPTFGANRHMLEGFGLGDRVGEMNRRLVALSRKAADGRAYIAGDVAPTGLVLESSGGSASIEDIFSVYTEQIGVLAEAGVDLLVIETMMSVEELTIAADAAASVTDLPVMCTMSVQADGQAYYGGSIYDAAEALEAMGVSAFGVNCCSGPDQLVSMVHAIRESIGIPVIAKPNAGMPHISPLGIAEYDMKADEFADDMMKLKEAGASILGGCCGTTPEYIRKMAERLSEG